MACLMVENRGREREREEGVEERKSLDIKAQSPRIVCIYAEMLFHSDRGFLAGSEKSRQVISQRREKRSSTVDEVPQDVS